MFALLLAAGIAVADSKTIAPPPAPKVEKSAAGVDAAMPSAEDFAKMMKIFDKIFPPGPNPEPARLARARGVALQMWPDGTYGNLFESFATSIGNTVLDMKPSDFKFLEDEKKDAKSAKGAKGAKGKAAAKPKAPEPDIPLREKLRAEDPNFDKRYAAISVAMHDEMQRISPLLEPPLREGLSRSLARRFTEPQLNDLAAFYASPTGQVYARESMKMWFDSDIMRAMMNSMPALMMQLPGAMERIKAASDSVPPPPKKAD